MCVHPWVFTNPDAETAINFRGKRHPWVLLSSSLFQAASAAPKARVMKAGKKACVMKARKKKVVKDKLKGDLSKGFFARALFQCPDGKKPLPTHGICNGKKIIQYALRLPKVEPLDLLCVWGSGMENGGSFSRACHLEV